MLEKNVPYQSCQIDFWLKMKLILFYNEFKIFRSELLAILHRIPYHFALKLLSVVFS